MRDINRITNVHSSKKEKRMTHFDVFKKYVGTAQLMTDIVMDVIEEKKIKSKEEFLGWLNEEIPVEAEKKMIEALQSNKASVN